MTPSPGLQVEARISVTSERRRDDVRAEARQTALYRAHPHAPHVYDPAALNTFNFNFIIKRVLV